MLNYVENQRNTEMCGLAHFKANIISLTVEKGYQITCYYCYDY